jgi:hypothetical protein
VAACDRVAADEPAAATPPAPLPAGDDRNLRAPRVGDEGTGADDRIDGVVITFADITVAKTLEAELREKQAALEQRVVTQTKRKP